VTLSVCGVLILLTGNLLGAELVYRHGRRVEAVAPAAVQGVEEPTEGR
jgi:uncharacterized membrane protein